jgi:hypothetical protein
MTNKELPGHELSPEEQKTRRHRNVAIAVTIGFLAVLFYAVTLAKLGVGGIPRPI